MASENALAKLPRTFTYTEARRSGISNKALYAMRHRGEVEAIGRGLYRRAQGAPEADTDLLEIAHKAPEATLCLATALARHDLTDLIPASIDVALPRQRRSPRVQAPVTWHRFDAATFELGRDRFDVDPTTTISIYSPVRSIVDAFRLRHQEGPDLARDALRRWLSRRDSHPAELLEMARHFPHAERGLREALEILL